MPYIHLTATPQCKGAIPEPFTGSISYIHIIMKSKICKVDIRKIKSRKMSRNLTANFFFVFEGWGVGWRVEDEFIPLFFFFKRRYKRIMNKSATFLWKSIIRKIRF